MNDMSDISKIEFFPSYKNFFSENFYRVCDSVHG